METEIKKKMKTVRVIYNDDLKIIDYLADLQDRRVIKKLQEYINQSKEEPICLLHTCPAESLFLIVLYKAPLGLNKEPNSLMLYIHDNITGLYGYFDMWLKSMDKNTEIYEALDDIMDVISHELVREYDRNTQKDFLG